jgi:hypothetical protein
VERSEEAAVAADQQVLEPKALPGKGARALAATVLPAQQWCDERRDCWLLAAGQIRLLKADAKAEIGVLAVPVRPA